MAFSHQIDLSQFADEQLARRIRSEPTAFDELYRRHVARVYRYLLVRIGDTAEAQDLTAQTFLAAFEGIANYRADSAFVAWLLGIARHKVADYFRSRRPDLPIETAMSIPSPDLQPEDHAIARLRLELVRQSLLKLASDRAEAITLRFFAGLSALEVGQVMGRSEAAIKMLVHRGLRDLKKALSVLKEE
ncbi:MAG: sigma-70 family RNA polymerase sigma factor [Anaerolineales bacterium]|nr:sigma-70 family RNA polymerase sigma factor [Anaerolineales bacterium]